MSRRAGSMRLRCLLAFRPLKRCHSMRKASWNSPRAPCSSVFSSISQGMFLVDRTGRIVWVNEGYKRFLPALGFLVGRSIRGAHGRGRGAQHADAPRAGNRAGDPDRPADQPGRDFRREPPAAARRTERRADRRDRHRAVRPSRNHAAAVDQQVRAPAARPGRRAARTGEPAPHQIHPCQLRRRQPGGGGGQAAGAGGRRCRPARCCCWAKPARARNCWLTPSTRPRRALPARWSASTSRPCPTPCWRRNSSASRQAPTPAPIARAGTASSSWPTAARCSSTRSATCRPACSPSCCAPCRKARSSRWAPTR